MSDQSAPEDDNTADVEIDLRAFLPEGVVIDTRVEGGHGAHDPRPEPDPHGAGEGGDRPTPDPSAAAAPAGQDGIDVELLDRVEQDLDAVDAALRSRDDGTYGTCEVCRKAIAVDVLAADPVRRTCPDHG